MKRVGFAGLGIMGRGMVKNLVSKGYAVRVWNRSPHRAESLGVDVEVAESPKAMTEGVDVVISCVSDPAAVERVVFAEDGVLAAARPGLRYVECSTVSPELVRRTAGAFESRGAAMIEAPVTGSKLGAERGTLLFMAGGPAALVSELEPLLLAMGSRVIHCGSNGSAALAKLLGNGIISFMLEGLCEALVVAQKNGLATKTVLEVVAASGFASPYFAFKGDAIARRDFETHFSIDLLIKDQSLLLAEGAAAGTTLPGLAAIREVFRAAHEQGLGQEDIAAVVKTLERMAGIVQPRA